MFFDSRIRWTGNSEGARRVFFGRMVLGFTRARLGRGEGGGSAEGYITILGGRILDPEREVSGLGLDGLQEMGFQW